jgi:hypothetical protein
LVLPVRHISPPNLIEVPVQLLPSRFDGLPNRAVPMAA